MSYCVNCGVELAPSAKTCPLCGTPAWHPELDAPPYFPANSAAVQPASRREAAILLTAMLVSVSLCCGLLNLFLPTDRPWSLYVIGAAVMLWVWFTLPMVLRRLPVFFRLTADVAAIGIYVWLISIDLGGSRWFRGLALPMIAEIQTKYKDKPEKQQEELMKLQQDFGYKPTAGCVPMLLNFLVMFGVIGVVYNPLERIFHISAAALASAGEAMTAAGISFTAITRDTNIIAEVLAGNSGVLGCFTAQQIATITEFGQHMNFLGIDLTRIPQIGLSLDIVLPLLSVITMFLSTHISMKASGQQMQGSMKLTMYMMPLMYLFFCFTFPLAFSLYYVISNIVMTVQTQVMRKFYDPEKMRKDVEAEIAAKRKQEKRGVKNTTIQVTDPKTGKTMEKNLSASEMNKRRLEYARQLDAERYKDERTVPLSELDKQDKQ